MAPSLGFEKSVSGLHFSHNIGWETQNAERSSGAAVPQMIYGTGQATRPTLR
jgi:hypothetical protein